MAVRPARRIPTILDTVTDARCGRRAADRRPIVLTGADLTIADVEAVARHGAAAALDVHARARMQEARDVIERLVAAGEVVYGVTTGFGDLATTSIPPADAGSSRRTCSMSARGRRRARPLPREVVRAMLLLRANTLALGHSGCRPLLVDRICELLDLGIHPVVPEQGSVGASGDLAPLAHLALPLIGRGQVELRGQVVPVARRAPRGRPGAADARGEGGPGAPQRDAADERARGAAPRGRGPARRGPPAWPRR